jgi:hypothetical protein
MNDSGATSKLNSAPYLYLRQLSEPTDNSLRLIVEEAVLNRSGTVVPPPEWATAPELTNTLRDASPIESVEGCRTFELYWKRYVAYLVTEEGVGSCGRSDDEVFTGRLLRHYSKSHFLDHLAQDTGGHTQPLQHYKLICLNHLIDVASEGSPEIQVVSAEAQAGDLVH